MRIGLIGCGRVGTTIFNLLKQHNTISGVYDSNAENERRAKKLLGIRAKSDLRTICATSDALFFATPDSEIVKMYNKTLHYITKRTYVYHFSGILPASVFHKVRSVYRGSVHPFATFPVIISMPPHSPYTLFYEGDVKAFRVARRIFRSRHFTIQRLSIKNKTYYHLIGVFSSNMLIGLLLAIDDLITKSGWKGCDARTAVAKIINDTLLNAKQRGLHAALSGPLVRGDIKVLRAHLKALSSTPHLLGIYKSLSVTLIKELKLSHKKKLLKLFN